jgi:hypothetical protein
MPERFYRFLRPSFLRGFTQAFDLSGRIEIRGMAGSPEQIDAAALHGDWIRVGSDLGRAMATYGSSRKNGEE